ncbi:hypothetical protein KSP40_PGU020302 [Platanthera guangdongensis]|uniref:Uncharacterized protein n=1 Tax=Platanthera guangdongensis TaxID=2320717 RepID=A0ABR2MC33_9ASPA
MERIFRLSSLLQGSVKTVKTRQARRKHKSRVGHPEPSPPSREDDSEAESDAHSRKKQLATDFESRTATSGAQHDL